MHPGGADDDLVIINKGKGLIINLSMRWLKKIHLIYKGGERGNIYFRIWKKIIDGLTGTDFGINALMNKFKSLHTKLMNIQAPCSRVFHKHLSCIF